jgi:hypothetical protein
VDEGRWKEQAGYTHRQMAFKVPGASQPDIFYGLKGAEMKTAPPKSGRLSENQ